MDIRKLCKQPENSYLEYKREWYWDLKLENESITVDKSKLWGEFIKDSLALINSNIYGFDKTRYMVIGYSEKINEFSDFNLCENKFIKLREDIIEKLNSHISNFKSINYKIHYVTINSINLIVFEIEQSLEIHFLIKSIQTKTTDYKKNTILCRCKDSVNQEGQDSVGVMHQDEIRRIYDLISKRYNVNHKILSQERKKSIHNTILSYLEKNRSFEISDGFPKTNNDTKGYFELYEINNILDESKMYFSYISNNNIKNSIENLYNEYLNIKKPISKIFFLIDKPVKTSSEKRIQYIKGLVSNLFKLNFDIEFIEEFGKKHLYKEYLHPFVFEHNFQNTENFIESFSSKLNSNHENIYATEVLEDWFFEENSPIIVLTGPGGVGKTTVVRNFLNTKLKTLKDSNEHYVLFLDSSSLLDRLNSDKVNTIYDLYKAGIADSKHFTEELFKLSIDNGSFIIILDGLDEILSGLNIHFRLQDFLQNIFEDYCFNLAKTKIVITCRDYIWDEAFNLISKNFCIENINIKPFNSNQAEQFFNICFKEDSKLQKKSMAIVNNLLVRSNEDYYSPFMLDTVYDLVKEKISNDKLEDMFEIDDNDAINICFIKNNMLDYLVYAVCKREEKKTKISFFHQIKILGEISKKNKAIDRTALVFITKDAIPDTSDNTISAILTHTFISCISDKSIMIRYDFLKDFFLKISIAQHFLNISVISNDILDLLTSKVSYQNSFSSDVGKRIFSLDKDSILLSIIENKDFIQSIINSTDEEDIIKNSKVHISNLFILYLSILKSKNLLKNAQDINEAIFDVFSNGDKTLSNLYLCNIRDIKSNPKLYFDFSNCFIDDCYIYNYSGFTGCTFNENTLFDKGTIKIENSNRINSTLRSKNISSKVIKLGDTSNILSVIEISLKDNYSKKLDNLRSFIKLFFNHGRFLPKKVVEIKEKRGGYDVKLMLSSNIIINHKDSKLNQDEYKINPSIELDLYKFLDSGVANKTVKDIIKSI